MNSSFTGLHEKVFLFFLLVGLSSATLLPRLSRVPCLALKCKSLNFAPQRKNFLSSPWRSTEIRPLGYDKGIFLKWIDSNFYEVFYFSFWGFLLAAYWGKDNEAPVGKGSCPVLRFLLGVNASFWASGKSVCDVCRRACTSVSSQSGNILIKDPLEKENHATESPLKNDSAIDSGSFLKEESKVRKEFSDQKDKILGEVDFIKDTIDEMGIPRDAYLRKGDSVEPKTINRQNSSGG